MLLLLCDRWMTRVAAKVLAVNGGLIDVGWGMRVLHLFERALQDDGDAENAVRAWAMQDAEVAVIISEVDQRRLAYTQDLFVAVGFSEFEALVRAKMVYYALLGEFMVSTPTEMADRLAEVQVQHKILTRQD